MDDQARKKTPFVSSKVLLAPAAPRSLKNRIPRSGKHPPGTKGSLHLGTPDFHPTNEDLFAGSGLPASLLLFILGAYGVIWLTPLAEQPGAERRGCFRPYLF